MMLVWTNSFLKHMPPPPPHPLPPEICLQSLNQYTYKQSF